jgi:hypothetical protein
MVFAPFAMIPDFNLARAVWMTVLELSLAALIGVSISLARWRISLPMLIVLTLFTAAWYHSVRPIINGNVSVLAALLIAVALAAIRADQDILAGLSLALAAVKPQMVVLLIPFVIVWAYSRKRNLLVWSTLGGLAFLIAFTSLFRPNWLLENIGQVLAYPGYTLPGTPGEIFAAWMPGVGVRLGMVLTVLTAGAMFWEWRAAYGKEFRWFIWAAYLTLVLTNLIGVKTATENYISLYPVLVLVLAVWDERWGLTGRVMIVFSMILLSVGLWGLFLATVEKGAQPVQNSILFFPTPVFLIVGLYWVRWWAVRSQRPLLDDMRLSESGRMG